jgi:hypothetical protein
MSRLFVHIATGPELPASPSRCSSRAMRRSGHDVDVFIAGADVSVLRPETLELANRIGTGSIPGVDALAWRRLDRVRLSSRPRADDEAWPNCP